MSTSALPVIVLGLDPLFQEALKLFVAQVKALPLLKREEGEFYVHHGHPVTAVEVMGMVQSVSRSHVNILYTVDDGTGVIACVQWIPHRLQMTMDLSTVGIRMYRQGDVLRVKGTVGDFRGARQIKIDTLDLIQDPDEESLFRLTVLDLEQSVYSKPFVAPERIQEYFKEEPHGALPSVERSSLAQDVPVKATLQDLKAQLVTWLRIWSNSTKQQTFSYFDLASVPEHKRLATAVARSKDGRFWPTSLRDQNRRVMHVLLSCIDELLADRTLVLKDRDRSIYEIQLGRSAGQAILIDDDEG
ncbi:CST complex subunit STN1 [Actinomortierella wolfii]|nr:CST complex subunit STN1 [Actinomortierella wolfii]